MHKFYSRIALFKAVQKTFVTAFAFLIFSQLYAQPLVTSFSPTYGPVGTTVTINGSGFNPTASNNIVYFGQVKASVLTATSTSISVKVPVGGSYQPITVSTGNLTGSSSIPFIVTFNGGGAITASSFSKPIDSAVGQVPYGVAIGDLDGDGKPDLISANGGYPYSFTIYRNTGSIGSISFAKNNTIPSSTTLPFDVALADLNGDGKLDIIMTNSGVGSTTLSVLENTSVPGSISFVPIAQYPTGTNPTSIAVGDLDGDGKPDIAVTDFAANLVSVFHNTSSGTAISFDPKVDYPTGSFPNSTVITDLDGDGKPDLVLANSSSGNFSVFKNTGSAGNISFAPRVDIATGNGPISIAAGDFDGDGKMDLAVNNSGDGTISIFRNIGSSGNIAFAPKTDFAAGAASDFGMVVSDLDGDGKPDLALANVSIIRNTSSVGNVSFAQAVTFPVTGDPYGMAVGDLDGDGMPDLAVAENDINTVSLYRNTISNPNIVSFSPDSAGTGAVVTIKGTNFTGATSVSFGGTAATSFTVVSDSVITAVVGGGTSGNISVATPIGTGVSSGFNYFVAPIISSFSPVSGGNGTTVTIKGSHLTGTDSVNFGGIAASSFIVVSDSVITAIVGTGASGSVYVKNPAYSTSLPGFSFSGSAPIINSVLPASGAPGTTVTISGAGFSAVAANNIVYFGAVKATVLSATATTIKTTVPIGATYQSVTVTSGGLTAYSPMPFIVTFAGGSSFGTNSFSPRVDVGTYTGPPNNVYTGDFDGDGRPDFIWTDDFSTASSMLRNTSSIGNISFGPRAEIFAGHSPGTIAIGDLDGDGKLDLAITNVDDTTVTIFKNTSAIGNISFTAVGTYYVGIAPIGCYIADLDGDGRPDLVVANSKYYVSTVSVFRNTSGSTGISFDQGLQFTTNVGPNYVRVADMDNDGKPDLVVSTSSNGTMSILRNTSTTGSISFAPEVDFAAENSANTFALSDLDTDGKLDIVVANYNQRNFSILRNLSTAGNLAFAPKIDFRCTARPSDIKAGDIDGDGIPDIVVSNYDSNTISLFKNLSSPGNISLSPKVDYATTLNPESLCLVDVDGDGRTDIVEDAVGYTGYTMSIFLNAIVSGPKPLVTSFLPDSASPGTTVTIKGTHFTGAIAVAFGGSSASSYTVVSDSVITAIVGTGASGSVRVTTTNGTDSLGGFTFIPLAPIINSFSPDSAGTGTVVTIKGLHFLTTNTVTFGNVAASSFTVLSDSVITAIVATGATGSVLLSSPAGSDSLKGFVFIAPSTQPTIYSFSPDSAASGATVTIKGIHFTGTTSVSFGGTSAASYNLVSDSVITAVVGTGASGLVQISTIKDTTSIGGFIYIVPSGPIAVISISPDSGTVGTHVTITGKNLSAVTLVDFAGTTGGSYSILSDSVISVVVGKLSGAGTIQVTIASATDTVKVVFTYLVNTAPPIISSFSPSSDSAGGTVSISGKNFIGATSVSFGGTPAASFTVVSDSLITAVVGAGSSGSVGVVNANGEDSLAGFTFIDQQQTIGFKLIGFTGSVAGKEVVLQWSAQNEQGISGYTVERSTDSIHFVPLGSVSSKGGPGINNYQFYDSLQQGVTVYYQLIINDTAGNTFESPVISVNSALPMIVYPNPATNNITVQYPYSISTSLIRLIDMDGRVLMSLQMAPGTTQAVISVQGIVRGIYELELTNWKMRATKRILVNH